MKNKIAIMLIVMFCLILLSGCGKKEESKELPKIEPFRISDIKEKYPELYDYYMHR